MRDCTRAPGEVRADGEAAAQHTAEQKLAAAHSEAFAFGRCCDLYQDGLGTFHCHSCGQATFAMLQGVQDILKDGSETTMDHEEATRAALIRRAAPDLLKAANRVIGCWEGGDLAQAVRLLALEVNIAESQRHTCENLKGGGDGDGGTCNAD